MLKKNFFDQFGDSNANDLVINLFKLMEIKEIDEITLQLCIKLLDQNVDPEKLAINIININNEKKSILS